MTEATIRKRLWTPVVRRDARYDGLFVYAVTSTGVYCRPSCPARKPAARNVRFFESSEMAERAGFRECRRCQPKGGRVSRRDAEQAAEVCRTLAAGAGPSAGAGSGPSDDRVTLRTLARKFGRPPHQLRRWFARVVGVTPRQYADEVRLAAVRSELRSGESILQAAYGAGYGSTSRLYEKTRKGLGMTPGTYRRGGAGEQVRYAIAPSPLGRLLVAGTAKGVCSVKLGDSDAELEAALKDEYPRATTERDQEAIGAWLAAVLDMLAGKLPDRGLPLDIQGTAFQRLVWDALTRIPRGSTRTYAQLAAEVGQPQAVRAVANACAANPVPIVVPCHRVVRSDGAPGGYIFGARRKSLLLESERGAAQEPGSRQAAARVRPARSNRIHSLRGRVGS